MLWGRIHTEACGVFIMNRERLEEEEEAVTKARLTLVAY
jgi:hypothetical protein